MITSEANETRDVITLSLLFWLMEHEIDNGTAGGRRGQIIHVHTINIRVQQRFKQEGGQT